MSHPLSSSNDSGAPTSPAASSDPAPTPENPADLHYASIVGEDWQRRIAYTVAGRFDASSINPTVIPSIAGATAGLASGIFTCPLDVIKTKLQAQGGWGRASGRKRGNSEMRYRGLVGTSQLIWREEGIRGMYRGLGPLILGYLPTWMVYFTVYEKTKETLTPLIDNDFLNHLAAALAGGTSSTLCTNPIWVIKTRLMSQASAPASSSLRNSPYYYNNTFDAARKMYLHEGIRSFYSGLAPALLGLTHVGVQFPVYEYLKKLFTGPGVPEGQMSWTSVLAASCLSKICASSATYPHEVLRTRLQTQRILNTHAEKTGLKREGSFPRYRGILHSVATIYREEGWRAFYSGMGTNMVRAVPASAMTLLTYELVNGFLKTLRQESLRQHHPDAAYVE